jgi:hypothetical protein
VGRGEAHGSLGSLGSHVRRPEVEDKASPPVIAPDTETLAAAPSCCLPFSHLVRTAIWPPNKLCSAATALSLALAHFVCKLDSALYLLQNPILSCSPSCYANQMVHNARVSVHNGAICPNMILFSTFKISHII